jgi:hypothetical protein
MSQHVRAIILGLAIILGFPYASDRGSTGFIQNADDPRSRFVHLRSLRYILCMRPIISVPKGEHFIRSNIEELRWVLAFDMPIYK